MRNLSKCACIAAWAVLLFALPSDAATLTFSGIFTTDDEVSYGLFQVLPGQDVTVKTTSYATGGFDPLLTIFDSNGLVINTNDDGGCGTVPAAANGHCLDAYLYLSITGGTYSFYVTQSPNSPLGDLADGFALVGSGNFTGGPFLDSFNYQRAGDWVVVIEGAQAIPEPSTWVLMVSGACALLWRRQCRLGRG